MDRYSFGTYLVDEHNQEAFSLCHDVANLKTNTPMPIVIIGDTGTGKTHLLYSIVARIRTSPEATGIAYVTANDIPESVRDLLLHPAPVKDAHQAVLVVDHLESFRGDIDVLERIIRLFLDNDHKVVCASNVHPARLSHFPGSFAKLLDDGHRVSIQPHDSPSRLELLENTLREEQEAIIAHLENELADLKQFVTRSSELHEVSEGDDESLLLSLRKELEVTRVELQVAHAKLNTDSSQAPPAQNEEGAQAEVQALKEELEQLRAEHALNAVASKEACALRSRIEALQSERDTLREQVEATNDQAPAPVAQHSGSVLNDHRARKEAQALVNQAEKMIREMQQNREKFSQAQKVHQLQLTEIKDLEVIFRKHEDHQASTAKEEMTTLTKRFEHTLHERNEAQEQYESLLKRLKDLELERNSAQCDLVDQQSELGQCKQALKEAQNRLGEKTEFLITIDLQMEQLRKDQAEATDRFNAEITRYEDRIAEYQSETAEAKQNESFLEGELGNLHTQLYDASERVQRLMTSPENALAENKAEPNTPEDTDTPTEGGGMLGESDNHIDSVPTGGPHVYTMLDTQKPLSKKKKKRGASVPEPPASIH